MLETWSHEGPQCPHCKRQFTADEPHYYDEQGYTEETCDDCGKTFDVEVQSSVAWVCTEKDTTYDRHQTQGTGTGRADIGPIINDQLPGEFPAFETDAAAVFRAALETKHD